MRRPLNFRLILTFQLLRVWYYFDPSSEFAFLLSSPKHLKAGQKIYLCDHPVKNDGSLKF